jgi:hypothetical protein
MHARIESIKAYKNLFALMFFLPIFYFGHLKFISRTGIAAEQYWIIQNRHSGILTGFLYGDESRPFLSLLFHAIYLIFGENYTAVILTNSLLTLVIAFLTFKISFKVTQSFGLSVIAGILILSHGGEQSTHLFSMLVLKQVVISLLVLILIYLNVETGNELRYKFIIIFFSVLALFTYEASLLVVVIIIGLIVNKYLNSKQYNVKATFFLITLPILFFILINLSRYFISEEVSYQSKKFRIPTVKSVFDSTQEYIKGIIVPNTWESYYKGYFNECIPELRSTIGNSPIILATVYLFLISGLIYSVHRSQSQRPNVLLLKEPILFLILVASYTPYFFVSDGIGNWRTQFIALPFFAILVVKIISNISFIRKEVIRIISSVFLVLFFTFWILHGLFALQTQQLYFAKYWSDHQKYFTQIIAVAPGLAQDTDILLLGIPQGGSYCEKLERDPFEDPYWLSAGFHVYYPNLYHPSTSRQIASYSSHKFFDLLIKQTGVKSINIEDGKNSYDFDLEKLIILEWNGKKFSIIPSTDFSLKAIANAKYYSPTRLVTLKSHLDDQARSNLGIMPIVTP